MNYVYNINLKFHNICRRKWRNIHKIDGLMLETDHAVL